ncbi:DUF447 domain-containing protein [Schlesneria paludicola]|uniref:DUF447 domain-containing protein n=1 Tax=Schlesneria paludicola TaxID=360056 RepID=UPI00029A4331|nr:DUF447 domain-containing protein [Schlesneria paludicola]
MIIEGLVTSLNELNEVNVAPMGPIVDESMMSLTLRPFRSSTTYRNLKQRPCGVFHVVDDVLLIAQAALDRLEHDPSTFAATRIDGRVLSDCCRWYEFEITRIEDTTDRTSLTAQVLNVGRVRDVFGFNRAKHAVLEATILATRLHLVSEAEIRTQLAALAVPVEKTAGPREHAAYQLVRNYVDEWYRNHPASP